MAVWSLTKAKMADRIETLYKKYTGGSVITYYERRCIDDAINAALQDVCLDYSVSRWRFLTEEVSATASSGVAYVDLTENIYNVISGTVRITSEDATLSEVSLEWLNGVDPDRSSSGAPSSYVLASSGTAGQIRMLLYPTPDSAYTITFNSELLIDEDEATAFPPWMHACLLDKCKDNALRDLGYGNEAMIFERYYEKRLANAKAANESDGPQSVARVTVSTNRNLQSRAGL